MVEEYFKMLREELNKAYEFAQRARSKGLDPHPEVEIKIATNVASRVEGLLGVEGIAEAITQMESQGMKREDIAFEMTKKIAKGELLKGSREELIDKAVRVGTAILTEGVLVAPTEGIARVAIEKFNSQEYVAVYYAGPIRSAGGTVAALTVVLADIARRELKIPPFKPDEKEINRVVEEIHLYDRLKARLQYYPPEEHIIEVLKNCPVCIDGEPTEKFEVSVNRDHPRISTNRVRSGVALVICEGILQKAAKVAKYTKKLGLDDWGFIAGLKPVKKSADTGEASAVYLDGLVTGRPIFAYPSRKGGFRLRYGRTFTTGIMGKNLNPATMIITNKFLAYGTQMKVEKPGKGAVVCACTEIDGPIVKLDDGSVVKVDDVDEAERLLPRVAEIIHVGDILVSVGDFLKSNAPLLPPGYVPEIWEAEARAKGLKLNRPGTVEEAISISKETGLPLHPDFLIYWNELSVEQLSSLARWLEKLEGNKLPNEEPFKRYLELMGVEHNTEGENIILKDKYVDILSLVKGKEIPEGKDACDSLSKLLDIKVMDKGGSYIGGRMGRPEKAKLREMEGKPHILFPTGEPARSISKLYAKLKARKRTLQEVEAFAFLCQNCKKEVLWKKCPFCNGDAKPLGPKKTSINLIELYDRCRELVGGPEQLTGVKGLSSNSKHAERLEKGFLRAKYGLYVFRDGTVRFDATDAPLTHFYAGDVGTSIEKLKELGYEKDVFGQPLEREDQILELYTQDILVSEEIVPGLINASKFVDEMLVKVYGMEPYYNIEKKEDLLGKLVICLSPHTSAGNLGRIIGFTKARVGYAHPYLHCAKRRNTDGDEDGIMLLMDGLINFSREYLSSSRGGTMDSPLILNVVVNPAEVDDEVHVMEVVDSYDFEFYKKAYEGAMPYEAEVKTVADLIREGNPYRGIMFTHKGGYLDRGPRKSTYIELKSIPEKAEGEIEVMRKIRAVDLRDAVEKFILSHFIPDIYGNLRKFSRQSFRCTNCNEKYRRVPLKGKCSSCRGELTLTIHKGGIEKYLDIAQKLVERFSLPTYLKQRLELVREEIKSIFEDEKIQQKGLVDFFT